MKHPHGAEPIEAAVGSLQPLAMRLPTLTGYVGLSASSIYEAMKDADPVRRFPQPVKVGSKSLWARADVDAWFERQQGVRIIAEC